MQTKLAEYRKKRNFDKTNEPKGKTRGRKNRPLRFAVQLHHARRLHYDFRLEWKGVLLSWAVPKGPSYNPADKRLAVRVEDHPVDYVDFEGNIPKGEYGGGTVMLWDEGDWEPMSDVDRGLKTGSLKFYLHGKRLTGKWTLVALKDGDNWLLIKEHDQHEKPSAGIEKYRTGVRSRLSEEQIAKTQKNPVNPFSRVQVMLPKTVDNLPDNDQWIFEVKYDGYRIVTFAEKGKVTLLSRNGIDYTAKFDTVARELNFIIGNRAAVLDGELIAVNDKGVSDFSALQSFALSTTDTRVAYVLFDLLALDGKDLRSRPLVERKKALQKLLKTESDIVRYGSHVKGNGQEYFQAAKNLGLEGIVGKRADSEYGSGRNGDWIKKKCFLRQEFVVGGYTLSDKRSGGLKALLLGFFEGKTFRFVGKVGTGFDQYNSQELLSLFHPSKTKKSPFDGKTPTADDNTVWLHPENVVEVSFSGWTKDNLLRQASFKGLRFDKPASEVTLETPQQTSQTKSFGKKGSKKKQPGTHEIESKQSTGKKQSEQNVDNQSPRKTLQNPPPSEQNELYGVKLSNPDRLVFEQPPVTKKQVAEYYAAAGQRMLKYAANRLLSVVRCHKGVSDVCFFKKHPSSFSEGVQTKTILNSDGQATDYFYLKDVKGLVSQVQLGTVEFHVWGSSVKDVDRPDMMVFDLDPDEGLSLDAVRQGVKDLKKVLDGLKLKSFLKTSGGKGYHVVLPVTPDCDWELFSSFAQTVVLYMERKWPQRYTSNIRKEKRKGKIFIDWIRNGRGATGVAAYSLRARKGAKVSMPIAWTELDKISPDGVDMFDAVKRLKKSDPWRGYHNVRQSIRPLYEKLKSMCDEKHGKKKKSDL